MTIATAPVDTQPLLLNISNTTLQVTPAQFDLLWIDNPDLRLGVRLGILVNPQDKQVEVYRLEREVEVFDAPMLINCEDVMPGFGLSLQKIW